MVLVAVLVGTGDLPGRDVGECKIGSGVAGSEKPRRRRRRVQGAERRVVRVSELCQLFRGGGGVVGMGGDDVVLGGLRVSSLHLCGCANLLPRARANHNWYLKKFPEDFPMGF